MTVRGLLLLMLLFWCMSPGRASEDAAAVDFRSRVLPILQSHCVRCHGPEKQESEIRLDNLSIDLTNDRAAAENWREVLNVLNKGEMPPEDEKPLSREQRATLAGWVTSNIKHAAEAARPASGRVVLRRLNRVEYQNTMTDLLGLEMNYARDLPPDAVSQDGFTNDGSVLRMSPIQLEYYLETARRAVDRVIVSGEAPGVFDYEFSESNLDRWLGKAVRSNRLGRHQEFLATMVDDYPESGEFVVRVKLTAELKPDVGFPLLEVSVGYRPDTEILLRDFELVEITSSGEQTLEFRGRLENFPLPVRGQGKYPGLVVRVRNRYDDGSPLPPEQKDENKKRFYPDEPHLPKILLKLVEFHGPVFDRWPPPLHRQILFDLDLRQSDELEYIKQLLARFMPRAYRRSVEDIEVEAMVHFYESIRGEFPSLEATIGETLAMVLIQPDFLYHLEPAGDSKRVINEFELASRLSYFLWSTMPDQRLMDLATEGKLRNQLSDEIERLLRDERSLRFVRQFTRQWLRLDYLDSVAVDRDYYPGFDDTIKNDMKDETIEFFAHLIQENLSAVNLLSSDFTMLNEPLAKHYGIEGVLGRSFRRVDVGSQPYRGGLLGHASVLLGNSTGADSHAVRRGVWIRDRLLNDPPSPPPPDVPSLEEADPKFHKLSIGQQLEIHSQREACASCHRDIDPWGIALENLDAVGLWRDQVRRKVGDRFETLPVQSSSVLPGGQALADVDSLKQYLVSERKDEFARSLISRLLSYALGRRAEWSDQPAIDEIASKFAADDYRLRGLIRRVVSSEPFQSK